MLERKGIAYKRTDLLPVISKGALRAVGFPGVTVPALKIDGAKVQGSRQIARELERLRPEPPLFPADPEQRAAVEEAERFGDEELQHPIRQILWWALKHDKAPLRSYSEGAKIGLPIGLAMKTAAPIVALSARFNEANDENARADLAALPALLDRVDELIAAGTIGGEQLNAADFQIAPSIGLAMTLDDLRPAIESTARRSAGQAGRPRLPRPDAADPPRRLARAAARPEPTTHRPQGVESTSTARSTRWPAGSAASASARRVPSGRVSSGSSSSSGARTKRRLVTSRCGRVRRSRLQLEIAEQEQVDVERAGAVAGRARRRGRARPRPPCRRRAAPPARARCGSGPRR